MWREWGEGWEFLSLLEDRRGRGDLDVAVLSSVWMLMYMNRMWMLY